MIIAPIFIKKLTELTTLNIISKLKESVNFSYCTIVMTNYKPFWLKIIKKLFFELNNSN